jgi:hypothetical protein
MLVKHIETIPSGFSAKNFLIHILPQFSTMMMSGFYPHPNLKLFLDAKLPCGRLPSGWCCAGPSEHSILGAWQRMAAMDPTVGFDSWAQGFGL